MEEFCEVYIDRLFEIFEYITNQEPCVYIYINLKGNEEADIVLKKKPVNPVLDLRSFQTTYKREISIMGTR